MDAATAVALVLGVSGLAWAAINFAVTRADTRAKAHQERIDERERRWLQEKRAIYGRMHAALEAQKEAVAQVADDVFYESTEGRFYGRRSGPDKSQVMARVAAGWDEIDKIRGELDLLAPDAVREAVLRAISELEGYGYRIASRQMDPAAPGAFSPEPFRGSVRESARALNAMRDDLGLGPVNEAAAAMSYEDEDEP